MYRCLFIINPSSGQNILQEKLDILIGKLVLKQVVNHIDTFYTTKHLDAYYQTIEAKDKNYDFLVVVGGDGTINEVISGLCFSKQNTPLLLMAAGTVNDFASYLQLPKDVDSIIKMIEDFHVIQSDVGKMNDMYFTNVCAAGMFSSISLTTSKQDKKLLGPLAYYVQGFLDFPNQLQTNMKLSFTFNNEEQLDLDALLVLVTNTNRVAGMKDIVPLASVKDGLLDVIIIKKCNIADLANLYKDYILKNHINNPLIIYKQVHSVDIISHNESGKIDVDGEDGGYFPLHASVYPHKIQLIVQKKTSAN